MRRSPLSNADPVAECAWPNAAFVTGPEFRCSAALVAPQLVVYAGHCGAQMQRVHLGDESNKRTEELVECQIHPQFGVNDRHDDYAWCRIAQPVDDVPIIPVIAGCETNALVDGAPVVAVGFGPDADGGLGIKRAGDMHIDNFITYSDFPQAIDLTSHMDGGAAACPGDSGGPSYIQLDDGTWRQFGIHKSGLCGGSGVKDVRVTYAVPWIERSSGIDLTPCHDADGTWNPTADCGQFPLEPAAGRGRWASSCGPGPLGGVSTTCGPAFGAPTDAGMGPDADSDLDAGLAHDADAGPAHDADAGLAGDAPVAPDTEDARTLTTGGPANAGSTNADGAAGCQCQSTATTGSTATLEAAAALLFLLLTLARGACRRRHG